MHSNDRTGEAARQLAQLNKSASQLLDLEKIGITSFHDHDTGQLLQVLQPVLKWIIQKMENPNDIADQLVRCSKRNGPIEKDNQVDQIAQLDQLMSRWKETQDLNKGSFKQNLPKMSHIFLECAQILQGFDPSNKKEEMISKLAGELSELDNKRFPFSLDRH